MEAIEEYQDKEYKMNLGVVWSNRISQASRCTFEGNTPTTGYTNEMLYLLVCLPFDLKLSHV